jgi:4-carboxymuconolactone decarboxylase
MPGGMMPPREWHNGEDPAASGVILREREAGMETYYNTDDLAAFGEIGKDAPELARMFFDYYAEVFKEGELTEREKSLIALAVAHAVQCPYCIDAYTRACLEKGSNLGEMTEAVHVAAAIRGGAALVHGVQMRKIAEKLSM